MTEKEKLIKMIEDNQQIQRYKNIEKAINSNLELKAKINKLKALQKQLINAKHIEKKEAILDLEKQYETVLNEIEEYPLMSDYLALQGDINEMIQTIQSIIEEGILKDFKS